MLKMARTNKEFDKLMFGCKRNPKRNPKNYRWIKKLETMKYAKQDYGKDVILWERKPLSRHHLTKGNKDARDAVWVEKKPTGWQVYTEKAHCDCGLGVPVFNKPVSKKEAMQTAKIKKRRFSKNGLGKSKTTCSGNIFF